MHTVPLTHQLVTIQDDFDLDKIIESGQCFRPQKLADGRYRFLSGGALLYLTPLGDGKYDAAWHGSNREYWANYFDLGRNYAALRCSLAGQSSYLDKSLDFGQGIRILHQDPWEMLITFLISQRKSIPAIRTAVEHLARCCGEPLSAEGDEVFLFPTPQQLCGLSGAQLMGCGLGYRTRYIQNAAAQASSGTLDLSALAALPDDALFSRLLELDGVGKKVANCVCLFGYGRTAMAPIDVWIQRLIDEEFGGRDPFPSYGQQAGIVFHGGQTVGQVLIAQGDHIHGDGLFVLRDGNIGGGSLDGGLLDGHIRRRSHARQTRRSGQQADLGNSCLGDDRCGLGCGLGGFGDVLGGFGDVLGGFGGVGHGLIDVGGPDAVAVGPGVLGHPQVLGTIGIPLGFAVVVVDVITGGYAVAGEGQAVDLVGFAGEAGHR